MNMERLKEIREDKDLTQKEVAQVINVTQQQYNKYELGINSIPIEKLNRLANFYNTSTDYLLYRTDERKPYPKSILNSTK